MSTDPNEQAHVIASTDTRAQTAETMCGTTLPIAEVGPANEGPLPGQPACGACYHELIGLYDSDLRRALTGLEEAHNRLAAATETAARRIERGQSNLLAALESAEARLDTLERKAKKGRRS